VARVARVRVRLPLYALVLAYGISMLGTAMSALAIPWLVLTTTGSAGRTGLVGFAEMAPYVTLQATVGPFVDRFGAKRGCVLGNAAAAAAVCAIPTLYASGTLRFGALVAIVAIAGAARGVADAATSPLVPGTARLTDIPAERAAGLYSTGDRTGILIGAPLAGIVISIASAPVVVLVDGLTFAVAAALIAALVPAAAQPRVAPDTAGYLARLGEGLRAVRADRLLLGIATMNLVTNLLGQALTSVLIPVWVRERIHEPAALGLMGGVMNIGALVGVLTAAWLGPRLPRRATYGIGFLLGGAPRHAALAFFTTLPPTLAITAFCGLATGALNPIVGAVTYERIPEHLQTRALGAIKASAWVGIPFGSLLGGALTTSAGLTTAALTSGACMLLATLAPFIFPAWRGMNRTAATTPDGPRETAGTARGGFWRM